jgi:hypothetical protein
VSVDCDVLDTSFYIEKQKQWEQSWKDSLEKALLNDPNPTLRIIEKAPIAKILKATQLIKYLYNEREILKSYQFYINFVKKYGQSVDLKRIERFQYEDMVMAITNQEVVWLRTRRGGKTRDLSLVNGFWIIVDKDPIWFTPQSDQQKQAIQYFLANPFYSHMKLDYVYFHGCKNSIEISNLTLGKSASKGKDCITYDEGAKVPKGQLVYDYYKFSRVIIAGKLWEGDKHILSASTAARNSAIEEEYELMKTIHPELISIHPYKDCWWISEDWIKQEELANMGDPWFVDQEYRTLFVNRGGSIFPELFDIEFKDIPQDLESLYGADFGGTDHIIEVKLDHDNKRIYICDESEVDLEVHPNALDHLRGSKFEAEGGTLYNSDPKHGAKCLVLQTRIGALPVPISDKWIHERLTIAKSYQIYIDRKRTAGIYNDLKLAIYDLDGTYLKNKKYPCHWLDAFFHAIGANRRQYFNESTSNNNRAIIRRQEQQRLRDQNRGKY